MKLLSFLNVSNRENPGSDSGVIFHNLLFGQETIPNTDIFIASPFNLKIPNTKYIEFEPGKNKYDVRFRFDWEACKEIIEKIDPDVVFCHQIEMTSSMKSLLVSLGSRSKLITYYHYIPILEIKDNQIIWDISLNHQNLAEIIFLRVISAVKTADVFFVTSNFSKRLLLKGASLYNIQLDPDKIIIMPPPVDPFFLTTKRFDPTNSKKVILYSSRLYEQYGTDFLLEIVDHYKDKGIKFLVTDFFGKKSTERKKLDPKVESYREYLRMQPHVIVREDGDVRKIYRDEIIAKSKVVLGPFRKNANWSMGMLDANMMGIPGIAPNFASFPEFMPSEFLFNDKSHAIKLLNKLLFDDEYSRFASEKFKNTYLSFTPQKTLEIFKTHIFT